MASLRPWVAYAQRRWRTTGLLVVALLGTVLYGTVADRGHDPAWTSEGDEVSVVIPSADGRIVHAVREGAGGARTLVAHASDGTRLWSRPLPGDALAGAGNHWIAIATAGPPARLVVARSDDGVVLLDDAVPGAPRALAADGETVAVAVQAPANTVYVWERMALANSIRFETFVNALDVADGVVVAGDADGRVIALANGSVVADVDTGLSLRALRLSADGGRLVVGGFGEAPGDLTGGLAVYELDTARGGARPLWRAATESGVGVVDVARDGSRVLALEEIPGRNVVRITAGDGTGTWRYEADGTVSRLGTSGHAGVRLSPDGSRVAVGTLAGSIVLLDVERRAPVWSWHARGATVVAFAEDAPGSLAANARLYPSQGYDRLARFDTAGEPFLKDMARLLPTLLLAEVATGALVLGVGRHRELRA